MKSVTHFLKYNLATCFGAGLSPVAPGTLGSLVGLLLVWLFYPDSLLMRLVTSVLLILISIYTGGWLAVSEGIEDPPQVVIDEVAGQWIAFLLISSVAMDSWLVLLAGFGLFRIFDIWKPWPVNRAERLPGGVGITMDDVVAGLMASIILRVGLVLF